MTPTISLARPPTLSLYLAFFCTLFYAIFNYTLSILAAPYIVADLGGSNDISTYNASFYAIGNALGIPLGRALLARIGTARFLVITLLLSAFFTWTTAISPTYAFFNVSRFMQGFACGPIYALVFLLSSMLEPKEKRDIYAAITISIFTIGPVVGACWGGVIAYLWDWRYMFYINIPLLLILAFFLQRRLKGFDSFAMPKIPFDSVGYLSFFIGILCLGFSVTMGQELDWFRSNLIIALTAIGSFSLAFFIFWELNHPHPILSLGLLKNPVIFFALFNLAILFSAYFGMIILLSLWLKLWVNYTPIWIALLLGSMAIAGLFPFSFIEEKMRRTDNRIFLAVAIVILALSCFHTMFFNVDINFGRIAFSRTLAGFGLALFLAPILRLLFSNVLEKDMLNVLGLFQVLRALSSGLGASVYATIWLRRQVFYHDRLGSQLTVSSPQTQEFFSNAEKFHIQGLQADAQLEFFLQRQSIALALDDCFYLMAWILVGLLLSFAFTFFCRRRVHH